MKTFADSNLSADGALIVVEGMLNRVFHNFVSETIPADEELGMEERTQWVGELHEITGTLTYSKLVDAMVSEQYSSDQVQALTANYMTALDADSDITDEKRAEYKSEYSAYQQARAEFKAKAKDILENGHKGTF